MLGNVLLLSYTPSSLSSVLLTAAVNRGCGGQLCLGPTEWPPCPLTSPVAHCGNWMTGELFLLHSALGPELQGGHSWSIAQCSSETPGTDGLCMACPALFSPFFPSGNLRWKQDGTIWLQCSMCPVPTHCIVARVLVPSIRSASVLMVNSERTRGLNMNVQFLLGKKTGNFLKMGNSKNLVRERVIHFPF